MAVVPLTTASSRTAAISRTPSSAVATATPRPRATPLARAVNAPPTAPPPSSSSSRREPPSLQGSDADKLREGIATFYDESSQLWEDVWGEHMHHGFYPRGTDRKSKTNAQAQVDLIDAVLTFAGVTEDVKEMVDVGCGIGGSSRHVAVKFPRARATGITLSPKQAARANELARAQGLGDRATFRVADALKQPFADGAFDLVWSLESGEHMPDKRAFVNELARVAAPQGKGTVVVATWVHRDLEEGETDLTKKELKLLGKINRAYYLPPWCSGADYRALFESAGLTDIRSEDWSPDVAPFWGEVIKSALTPRGVVGLLRAGWGTIKGALAMPLMARGFKKGLIKFVVITGKTRSKVEA